ncbi:Hypothetical protein NTJ_06559 [Nesidiocoris tenuis]|uniref:Uncharacterized protein n=1 Tax=Nesidiocoris tenuis TaxID=355587 RepID=A0ABN7AS49_9HEMI|nr:Hypothetical protein NTJ_06559 [Nesidiocoris tenuis]
MFIRGDNNKNDRSPSSGDCRQSRTGGRTRRPYGFAGKARVCRKNGEIVTEKRLATGTTFQWRPSWVE